MKRAKVQALINASIIKHISFEIYKKTAVERIELENAKTKHKSFLKLQDRDPKKHIN